MKYAEVAVNSPFAGNHSYCYSIPPQYSLDVGQAVWVPFGPRTLQGIVVELSDSPSFQETKEIGGIIAPQPLLTPVKVRLAQWLSRYYMAALFDCIALMLPPGFERRINTCYQLSNLLGEPDSLIPEQRQILELFQKKDVVSPGDMAKIAGKKKAAAIARELVAKGILLKIEELSAPRVKLKTIDVVRLNIEKGLVNNIVDSLRSQKKNKPAAIIEFLSLREQPAPMSEVRKNVDGKPQYIKYLVEQGFISLASIEVRRDPLARYAISPVEPPQLTLEQEGVWLEIKSVLENEKGGMRPFLLQGVTGSGKTEIYLRALAEVIKRGKKGICLVPEIALTHQTIERFVSRFPGRVAVFHSGLSPGEQFDEWYRIQRGECDVVIGPRSALFTPQPDLGLIIIDEEHEWTYKQADKSPRYHARTAALKLAGLSGSMLLMGSATPDVESYYHARQGEYHLLSLQERITVRGITPLPEVEIVDLREELKAGNRSIFSRSLLTALAGVLKNGEQAILYLNRRGTANFMRCLSCGFVVKCPRCLVALTYHTEKNRLSCHHCGYSCDLPGICPECLRPRLKMFGVGTQKVEEETRKIFPHARIVRWDRDVTTKRGSQEEILKKLLRHEADILIGTQMIAKGLDLPQVTLAGVINADTGLNLPDFRAGERTFQLTCQIAGRAGRGLAVGRVIIQTYSPQHYAIQAAAKHDYQAFFEQEINYRQSLGYPPFSQMANLIFSHKNLQKCELEARKLYQVIVNEIDRRGIPLLRLVGPMPSLVPRVSGNYRWQILLIGSDLPDFLAGLTFPRGWVLDIDPVSVI